MFSKALPVLTVPSAPEKLPATRATPAAATSAKTSARRSERNERDDAVQALSIRELAFVEHFAQYNNATLAYASSHDCTGMKRNAIQQAGFYEANKPRVQRMLRVLMSEAARGVDVQALIDGDRRIVEAFEHYADQVTTHALECCRQCHGVQHYYQWVDALEYLDALQAAEDENDDRRARKLKPKALPNDAGGYGFTRTAEPVITCPKCEGRGVPATYFADTSKLVGPARYMVKGIKHTANGIELMLHDYDKAKERLMRATGSYGDDAASVARGAAAGAAAGAGAAQALAARVGDMTEDDARKAYLALVQG